MSKPAIGLEDQLRQAIRQSGLRLNQLGQRSGVDNGRLAALACYLRHQEQVDAYFAQRKQEAEELRREIEQDEWKTRSCTCPSKHGLSRTWLELFDTSWCPAYWPCVFTCRQASGSIVCLLAHSSEAGNLRREDSGHDTF
jgi:hypothetical protein